VALRLGYEGSMTMELRDAACEAAERLRSWGATKKAPTPEDLLECARLLDMADDADRKRLDGMTTGARGLVDRLRHESGLADTQAHVRDAVGDPAEAARLRVRAAGQRAFADDVEDEVLGA